jgi:hypothetical protein
MGLRIDPENIAGGSQTRNDLLTSAGHFPATIFSFLSNYHHQTSMGPLNTLPSHQTKFLESTDHVDFKFEVTSCLV